MTISKSLSDQAIEEFKSNISNDQTLPKDLRTQLLKLVSEGTWDKATNVSDTLAAFHSASDVGDKK
jgi:hypothetical protein